MTTSIFILVLAVHSLSAVAANNDIPEECRDLTYCTVKGPNYPQEKINNMYKNLQKKLVVQSLAPEITFPSRGSGPTADGEDDCEVTTTVEDIYHVREDVNKPWRTVVQVPNVDYLQRVRLVICVQKDATCFNTFAKGLSQFVTYCHQKYISYKFLVLKNDNSNETETAIGQLPVCCSCRYKEV
ncbi:uncharacterized protein LOC121726896 [Aricia agestis]|uniref:uncharacterized protein LOC121726896 n=1 Tax=Aricia agestis TaxID=91739 RepID=UPI001C206AA5|nr:uncharacterized protein LOC121726896 [Aricia agestis]